MIRTRITKIQYLLSILLLASAVGLCWWSYSHPSVEPSAPSPIQPAKTPVQEAAQPGYAHWGGASCSAEREGRYFFDLDRARKFATFAGDQSRYVLLLHSRALLPDPQAKAEEALRGEGEQEVYLQFLARPKAEERAALAQAGISLNAYVAGVAWQARETRAALAQARGFPFVRALAAVDPRDKLHPAIFLDHRPPHAMTADGRIRYQVLAYPGTAQGTLAQEARDAGAELGALSTCVLGPRYELVGTRESVLALAASPHTQFFEIVPPPVASRDSVLDHASNVDDVRDAGPLLDGTDVMVAIRELNKIVPHADFSARYTYVDPHIPVPANDSVHATAVAGQIGGDGSSVPAAKGVAPNATLLGYDITSSEGDYSTEDIEDADISGARISNHSYGPSDPATWDGVYSSFSADWDTSIADNDLVVLFAGNEESSGNNLGKIDFLVGSKNVIDVAATNDSAKAADADDVPPTVKAGGIASFSDFGTMADGRVKPDLAANGTSVSLLQGTTGSQTNNGTSFACPAVTGMTALMFQHYFNLFGDEPSAALTKALLLNSATDLGNTGPDAQYGFGIADVETATQVMNDYATSLPTDLTWHEGDISDKITDEYFITIGNQSELKVMLVWMDPPKQNLAAVKDLVNDLDLEVLLDPNPSVFPYSLDPANPGNPATASAANTTDNVEQVIIPSPTPGTYTIRVTGTSVNVDAPQHYAVVVNRVPSLRISLAKALTAPAVNLGGVTYLPATGGVPQRTVNFSATITGGTSPYTVAWDFDGNGVPNVTDVGVTSPATNSFTYSAPGASYTVKVTVTDAGGKVALTTTPVVVLDPPVADLTAAPDTGPVPLTVYFNASGSTGKIATYTWDFGDLTPVVITAPPVRTQIHDYTTFPVLPAVTYPAQLTVTDVVGQSDTTTADIAPSRRILNVFAHRLRANLNFAQGTGKLQMVLIVSELALSKQAARDLIAGGTLASKTYSVVVDPDVNKIDLGTFTLDATGKDDGSLPDRTFRLYPSVLGQIRVTFNDLDSSTAPNLIDIFNDLLMTSDPLSNTDEITPYYEFPVRISSDDAEYNATFRLTWKVNSKGTSGKAKEQRIP